MDRQQNQPHFLRVGRTRALPSPPPAGRIRAAAGVRSSLITGSHCPMRFDAAVRVVSERRMHLENLSGGWMKCRHERSAVIEGSKYSWGATDAVNIMGDASTEPQRPERSEEEPLGWPQTLRQTGSKSG
jgi:hypothetical protein